MGGSEGNVVAECAGREECCGREPETTLFRYARAPLTSQPIFALRKQISLILTEFRRAQQ